MVFESLDSEAADVHRDTNREKRQKVMSGLVGERWEEGREGETVSKMSFHGF